MFYLEAQNKVDESPLKDEIQQGDVHVIQNSTSATPTSRVNGAISKNHRRKKSGR